MLDNHFLLSFRNGLPLVSTQSVALEIPPHLNASQSGSMINCSNSGSRRSGALPCPIGRRGYSATGDLRTPELFLVESQIDRERRCREYYVFR
jgi:hypothetical protein